MITPLNITRHELIGLTARIVSAKNNAVAGIQGMITDETQKTLEISGKKVFKAGSVFELTLPDKTRIEIAGEKIEGRPCDRIKKRKN